MGRNIIHLTHSRHEYLPTNEYTNEYTNENDSHLNP